MINPKKLEVQQIKECMIEHLQQYTPDAIEHVPLIKILNELSPLGFPLLVTAVSEILADIGYQKYISDPVRSAFERVGSTVPGKQEPLKPRFEKLKEDHLFNQFKIFLDELQTVFLFKELTAIDYLKEVLWLAASQWLIDQAELKKGERLRRILINISEALGDWALLDGERFQDEWTSLMIEHLRVLGFAGGELSVVLPGSSNVAGRQQLQDSGLLADFRGLKKLTIEGRDDVLAWISAYGGYHYGITKGLEDLEAIDLRAISDEQIGRVALLQHSETPEQKRLFDLIKQGVSQRAIRDPKPDDLGFEPESDIYTIAQHCRTKVSKTIAGERFDFSYIPAGSFWMGSKNGVGYDDERPQHQVKISKAFWLGQTPVTQEQWQAIMGSNPSHFADHDSHLPVETVSWFDCVRYCNKLSEADGYDPVYSIGSGDEPTVEADFDRNGYRLPTEAEWEYAAKAGTELIYAGSNNIDEVAWYGDDAGEQTMIVAQLMPNEWGLYDMSGNVDEWCSDQWNRSSYQGQINITTDPHEWVGSASARVYRGGYWSNGADYCRVAGRNWLDADSSGFNLGLRLLRCEL